MNEKKPSKKPHIVPTLSKSTDDYVVEALLTPDGVTKFVYADGGDVRIVDTYKTKESLLVPYRANNSLLEHRVVLLPSEVVDACTTEEVIDDIRTYINTYVDISSEFLALSVFFFLLTWLYDKFNELPYLRVAGDFGSGKTRFLLVIGSICNKPIFASGATTVSPIFHILDAFGGTLLMDEADFRFSDEKADIVKILNNGNVRGFPVLRSEQSKNGEYSPRAFSVFGPKIVATRGSYDDPALESRFLTEEMGTRPLPKHIPINLPPVYETEALVLRNKLLMFRIKNYFRNIEPIVPIGIVEPRVAQIFGPLLAMIDDASIRKSVSATAVGCSRNMRANRELDVRHHVLDCIHILSKHRKAISIGTLTKTFIEHYGDSYSIVVTPRWIGGIVRGQLKLRTQKRTGTYIIAPDDLPKLPSLYARYGIEDAGDIGEHPQAA